MRILDYWFNRVTKKHNKSLRLGMCLLVKDEIDIIEDNIKYHASLGIDKFIITDNGSTDGTREALNRLSKDFDIHLIDQLSTEYLQSKWTTNMANIAREKFKIDWLICSDADEFWIPEKNTNIKSIFNCRNSIVNFDRVNMIMPEEAISSGFDYSKTTLQVKYPVLFSKAKKTFINDQNASVTLEKLGDKVAVNLHGLIRVKTGNHNAKHAWRPGRTRTNSVKIYHYPFRTYEVFKKKIANIEKVIKQGRAELGLPSYRWVKQFKEGNLFDEYKRLIINTEEQKTFKKFGLVIENNIPSNLIHKSREKCL